ncbi:hypothetical protein F383_19256 [Gossypium arboreum]|uniref:Uncharacterized protein n=1 Tax=Gossypium arboreum TaxID=29729 RepID=A0A0B0NLU0_GOSAR|nr:hypothetical protein F383_19256 [Gossypium arboreum]
MPQSPPKCPFLIRTRLGLDRDMLIASNCVRVC